MPRRSSNRDGSPQTAHTTNPVPLIVTTPLERGLRGGGELADLVPTALELLGLKPADAMTGKDLRDDAVKICRKAPRALDRRLSRLNYATLSLPQPDLAVLRKAQQGDERAFSIIVRTYETPVYNYVLRLTATRRLAEDLTQEVFLRVFQGLPRFSLRCKFTTWLFQVTKNSVLDELRAKERRPLVAVNLDDAPQFEVLDAPVERVEAIDALWRARQRPERRPQDGAAPPRRRRAPYNEIADSLEITLATVKWRIFKAREEVQLALAREGITSGSAARTPVAAADAI